EKAHPRVFDAFLQVFGEGRLTNAAGRTTDFCNAILIMTSNIGARDLARSRPGFFDGQATRAGNDDEAYKKLFSPEFRNRLDARIRFAPLGTEVMLQIAEKFCRELADQLAEQKVTLEVTDTAKAVLARLGYDPQNGARPMDRVIREQIKRPIADDLLFGRLADGGHLIIDAESADAEGFVFRFPDAESSTPAAESPPEGH
ncbi:MAG: AAA family ATPase, partial [Myxococcales bacterium]|nr:AAA family ATPase [Myxococcales bacterium]